MVHGSYSNFYFAQIKVSWPVARTGRANPRPWWPCSLNSPWPPGPAGCGQPLHIPAQWPHHAALPFQYCTFLFFVFTFSLGFWSWKISYGLTALNQNLYTGDVMLPFHFSRDIFSPNAHIIYTFTFSAQGVKGSCRINSVTKSHLLREGECPYSIILMVQLNFW